MSSAKANTYGPLELSTETYDGLELFAREVFGITYRQARHLISIADQVSAEDWELLSRRA